MSDFMALSWVETFKKKVAKHCFVEIYITFCKIVIIGSQDDTQGSRSCTISSFWSRS